jgi:DNA-binding XRE family transcriptional regulator
MRRQRRDSHRSIRCRECSREIPTTLNLPGRIPAVLCLRCLARRREPTFAETLRAHRVAAGLTQQELADQVGCHKKTVSKIEGGRRQPSGAFVLAAAKALGLRVFA